MLRWLCAVLLATAVTGVVGLTGGSPACACSCAGLTNATQLAARADAVFIGTVQGVGTPGVLMRTSSDPVVATIKVDAVYRGDVASRVEVATPVWEGSCGVTFRRGVRYVVYADREPGTWEGAGAAPYYTWLCSGTAPLDAAGDTPYGEFDATVLGPARSPRAGAELGPAGSLGWALGVAIAVVAGLGGIPAALLVRTRRQRTRGR